MLPPAAFTDPAVLDWELEEIFAAGWICVGHVSQVSEPGRFLMREIGRDSVIVIGGEDGRPRAFHNVCRHRGSRLITEGEGSVKRRLRCPYHAWSYDLDGSLRASPHMDGVEGFDPDLQRAGAGAPLDDRRPAPDRPRGRGAGSRRAHRRPARAPGALPECRASQRRQGRLRRRRELEGHRRELQRVPALPGRPSGAERAQQLHERRGDGGRRRLVRRLHDADRRGCGDDGERRGPRDASGRPSQASRRTSWARSSTSRSSRTPWSRSIPTT